MNSIGKWQKIYELNCRLKAQLNSARAGYNDVPKNLDATELADWRLCTAYIDWVLDTVDRTACGIDFRGNEILTVLEFYFDTLDHGVRSSHVKNFGQLLDLLSAIRRQKENKSSEDKSPKELSWEIVDRITENKEARKEA